MRRESSRRQSSVVSRQSSVVSRQSSVVSRQSSVVSRPPLSHVSVECQHLSIYKKPNQDKGDFNSVAAPAPSHSRSPAHHSLALLAGKSMVRPPFFVAPTRAHHASAANLSLLLTNIL